MWQIIYLRYRLFPEWYSIMNDALFRKSRTEILISTCHIYHVIKWTRHWFRHQYIRRSHTLCRLVFVLALGVTRSSADTVLAMHVPFWEWTSHDDVIKWMHCRRYWPFVREIHRSTGNSPHKGQWRGALIFSLICAWLNGWTNNRDAGDLRRHRAPFDVIVVTYLLRIISTKWWEMQITIYFTSKQPSISRNIHILSVICTFAMCCLNAYAKKYTVFNFITFIIWYY